MEFERVQKDLATVDDFEILILGRNVCKAYYYS